MDIPQNVLPTQNPAPVKSRFPALIEKSKTIFQSRKKLVIVFLLLFIGAIVAAGFLKIEQKGERVKVDVGTVTLKPTAEDSLGVEPNSEFVLSSQGSIEEKDLRASLSVEPESTFTIRKESDKEYKISFDKDLDKDKIYKFKLATQVEGEKELSWAFQIKGEFRVINTLPNDKSAYVPQNTGIEITFSHDNYGDVSGYFDINPKVEGRFERHKRTLVFVPKALEAGTIYTVTLKKGLPLTGTDKTLQNDHVFQFETQQQSSQRDLRIRFAANMSEFPKDEKPVIGVYYPSPTAAQEVDVVVFKFNDASAFISTLQQKQAVPYWAYYKKENFLVDTSNINKVLEFKAVVQELDYSKYFVFPDNLSEGYYLVELKSGEAKSQAWLQITSLAGYASVSNTKTLVWVNDVETKNPVSEATVKLIGEENISAKTSDSGVALYDTPKSFDEKKQGILEVSSQGKSLVMLMGEAYNQYGYYWGSDSQTSKRDEYWSHLYIDRPVYLPTDKIGYWGMVQKRDNPGEAIKPKLVITHSDYFNYFREPVHVYETELSLSDMGTFVGEIPLNNLRTGYYSLAVRLGEDTLVSSGFSVETYYKPAYKIEVSANKKAIFAGETVEFSGKTMFYEGTAVPSVELKYSGNLDGRLVTDSKGEFKLSYTSKYKEDSDYPAYYDSIGINLVPALAEEGDIEGGSSVRFFNTSLWIKAKANIESDTKAKLKVDVENITLDRLNNGSAKNDSDFIAGPASNKEIRGAVNEYYYEKVETGEYYDFINKTVAKKYEYKRLDRPLGNFSATTDSSGHAEYEFDISPDKYYELVLEVTDDQGRNAKSKVYAYGYRSRYQESNYYHLTSNKTAEEGYSLGEEVKLSLVKGEEILPQGENNKYLFRIAQRGIREVKVQDSPDFTFEYKGEFIPNVYVQAVRWNGRTFYVSDTSSFKFKKDDKKLAIEVLTDKISYKPSETVNVEVLVKDKDGNGKSSEVNLSLVDEAVFSIAPQSVDTLTSLYKSVASGVFQSYVSHQIPLGLVGAEGGGCFLEGTEILLTSGNSKKIENVKEGERILTRESERSKKLVSARVSKVYKHTVNEYIIVNGGELKVTPEHNLYVNGRWMVADDLKEGFYLLDRFGEWREIVSLERRDAKVEVYNLEIEGKKTFFANGFYVHNQKGRELFADRAFFGTVQTDSSGRGKTSFKLPDNLTSWRMTYQAISQDMGAGSGTKGVAVRLPFFIDVVLNSEYLESDSPTIKLRAFGEKLSSGTEVEFSVEAPTLGIVQAEKLKAKAFESADFAMPPLTSGSHKITVTGKGGGMEDKITREIKVYKTRLAKRETDFQVLTSGISLKGDQNGRTSVTFIDAGTGKYYPDLLKLSFVWGDRIDQKLARVKAGSLLNEFFSEDTRPEEFSADKYQREDGGISLFPYSDSELELSADVVALAGGEFFDANALKRYFNKIVDDPKEGRERTIIALYGLSALGEPVLVPVNNLLKEAGVTPKETIYLGLALAASGAKEDGRVILKQILEEHGESFKPMVRVNIGEDQDDIISATVLTANLAALVGSGESEGLYEYARQNSTTDILAYLGQLKYIKDTIKGIEAGEVEFSYTLAGKQKVTKTLKKAEKLTLDLSYEELQKITFDNIKGQVGVATAYLVPFSSNEIIKDENITIGRTYSVSGVSKNEFNETDLVLVTINYGFGQKALDGCYQVTDFLPSGLRIVQKPYTHGIRDDKLWYAYDIENQKISFCVGQYYSDPIRYYARVVSKGEFVSENAIIQSLKSTDSLNLTPAGQVDIN